MKWIINGYFEIEYSMAVNGNTQQEAFENIKRIVERKNAGIGNLKDIEIETITELTPKDTK